MNRFFFWHFAQLLKINAFFRVITSRVGVVRASCLPKPLRIPCFTFIGRGTVSNKQGLLPKGFSSPIFIYAHRKNIHAKHFQSKVAQSPLTIQNGIGC
jgi:hypothetical protein